MKGLKNSKIARIGIDEISKRQVQMNATDVMDARFNLRGRESENQLKDPIGSKLWRLKQDCEDTTESFKTSISSKFCVFKDEESKRFTMKNLEGLEILQSETIEENTTSINCETR